MRSSLCRCRGASLLQQAFDPRHRDGEILVRAGPARGEDSGRAVERIDGQSGIVGERRKLCGLGRRYRLDLRVGAKAVSDPPWLPEAELAGRDSLAAAWRR